MTVVIDGTTGIKAPALELETPLAETEGGTGKNKLDAALAESDTMIKLQESVEEDTWAFALAI